MTRHSKNATAGPSYTYHEKQKDCHQSGYGSKDLRLNKDSIKEFDCCSLSLQPCKNPVITPDGWIYDKEVILEYIIHQKTENLKRMREFEKYKSNEDKQVKELDDIKTKEKIENFMKTEGKLVSSTSLSQIAASKSKEPAVASVSNMSGDKFNKLPSFWIPSLCPSAKKTEVVKKPDTKVYCPMSNNPITLKDLIQVNFKLVNEKDGKPLISKEVRYVCAVTNDVLTNSVPCAVLRPSGAVVTLECVEKLIKKDMMDPINGAKLKDSDIIPIQRGGTGFAGSGVQLKSKIQLPAMIS